MAKFLSVILSFILGFIVYKYVWAPDVNSPEGDRLLKRIEKIANKFCACNRNDRPCLMRGIEAIKKLKPEFELMDKKSIRVSASQKKRAKEITEKIRRCHFK